MSKLERILGTESNKGESIRDVMLESRIEEITKKLDSLKVRLAPVFLRQPGLNTPDKIEKGSWKNYSYRGGRYYFRIQQKGVQYGATLEIYPTSDSEAEFSVKDAKGKTSSFSNIDDLYKFLKSNDYVE